MDVKSFHTLYNSAKLCSNQKNQFVGLENSEYSITERLYPCFLCRYFSWLHCFFPHDKETCGNDKLEKIKNNNQEIIRDFIGFINDQENDKGLKDKSLSKNIKLLSKRLRNKKGLSLSLFTETMEKIATLKKKPTAIKYAQFEGQQKTELAEINEKGLSLSLSTETMEKIETPKKKSTEIDYYAQYNRQQQTELGGYIIKGGMVGDGKDLEHSVFYSNEDPFVFDKNDNIFHVLHELPLVKLGPSKVAGNVTRDDAGNYLKKNPFYQSLVPQDKKIFQEKLFEIANDSIDEINNRNREYENEYGIICQEKEYKVSYSHKYLIEQTIAYFILIRELEGKESPKLKKLLENSRKVPCSIQTLVR